MRMSPAEALAVPHSHAGQLDGLHLPLSELASAGRTTVRDPDTSPFEKRGNRVIDCLLEATDALGYAFLPSSPGLTVRVSSPSVKRRAAPLTGLAKSTCEPVRAVLGVVGLRASLIVYSSYAPARARLPRACRDESRATRVRGGRDAMTGAVPVATAAEGTFITGHVPHCLELLRL
jgi:hypothetical protein